MKTIWKYQLPLQDSFTIDIPKGAKILSLQTQENIPCIWILVNKNRLLERRTFKTFGTGFDEIEDRNLNYIGTYQVHEGSFVFHVFEVLN